ncbi:MAG: hypothetical protein WC836_20125 [Desulfobacula sp.]|jgi:hypothetical protein
MGKTNANEARELAKNSSDCSFLLTHLVRQNTKRTDDEAKEILKSILDIDSYPPSPNLQSSSTGWYNSESVSSKLFDPKTTKFILAPKTQCVCFTESTLAGLKAHKNLFHAKYGLAFDRDLLFSKGAAPCINIPDKIFREEISHKGETYKRHVYNYIPEALTPFVNIINTSFDATHEREWRVAGDINFFWKDVKFIFCPEQDFKIFSKVQIHALPTLFDLEWLDRI